MSEMYTFPDAWNCSRAPSPNSSVDFSKLPVRLQNFFSKKQTPTREPVSTFHEPSARLHLTHTHWLSLYLHLPHTADHLCPSHSSTVPYPTKLQSSCAKKEKSFKEPEFNPFVLELVPYNSISPSAYMNSPTERYTCKNWSKYTRLPFIISCIQEQMLSFTSLIKKKKHIIRI